MTPQLRYGNWIRKKVLWRLAFGSIAFAILAVLPLATPIRVLGAVLSLILLVSLSVPLYAYYVFSPRGGNLQERMYDLIVASLGDKPKTSILDIGTGNGVLAVKLALANRGALVTGIDYWGSDWEYAKEVCEANADAAGVAHTVRFAKGDAAALTFPNASFDAVVSNLTFHEVRSVQDKRLVLQQALRVLGPAGVFIFIDYFHEPRYYGPTSEFESFIQTLGLHRVNLRPLPSLLPLPRLIRHPRIMGNVSVLSGQQ
jgi:SAM-dependent methyltransferase